ncbi:MAG: Asp/Glu racemase [Chloroflexi bacterium]|nr:Asp/Glu racemase [Chloroflexota bacterium]
MASGWRARIGLLCPADESEDREYWKYVPEGVAVLITRIAVPPEELDVQMACEVAAGSDIEESAKRLVIPQPQCIALACTELSFIRGVGYDEEISQRIQRATGIRATTTSTASVNALRKLGVRKVAVATPYSEDINQKLAEFLEGSGFEVISMRGLGIMYDVPAGEVYRFAREVDEPSAEAVFISCTGFCPAEVIEPLEQNLGKPVVAAAQATMWETLNLAGVRPRLPGLGCLYS